MSDNITLTISMFGAFRAFSGRGPFVIEVPHGATLTQVRLAVKQELKQHNAEFSNYALVDESALADEKAILHEDAIFTCNATLAILPPVCGG